MSDAWSGRPENPGRDGNHWLQMRRAELAWWCAKTQRWDFGADDGDCSPGWIARVCGYRYLGPALLPAEVAALTAAAEMRGREDAAKIHDDQAARSHVAGQFAPLYAKGHLAQAARIRALPPPSGATALAAMLDQARREEREACAAVAEAIEREGVAAYEADPSIAGQIGVAVRIKLAIRARKETRDAE